MSNGYIKLKVTLPPTKISRTIVVPGDMTLDYLNDAIQAVMGWENCHLWNFTSSKRGRGVIYAIPRDKEDDFVNPFAPKEVRMDATKTPLYKVLPVKGSKVYYEYDFGDGWKHVITRMMDPRVGEIICEKSKGADGIEDFGGPYNLAHFLTKAEEVIAGLESFEGLGNFEFEDEGDLREYLAGRTKAELTAALKRALDGVGEPESVPTIDNDTPFDSEQAKLFSDCMAITVNTCIWNLIEEAMRNGGSFEFYDPDKEIIKYFLDKFPAVKIKDAENGTFHIEPSKITLPKNWVQWYNDFGEKFLPLREQFDLLEMYASAAVNLYGFITIDELRELILRYDPGFNDGAIDWVGTLRLREYGNCLTQYRFHNDLLISNKRFPPEMEGLDKAIWDVKQNHEKFPRMYPETRQNLFLWNEDIKACKGSEVNALRVVLGSIYSINNEEQIDFLLDKIFCLIIIGVPPDVVYKCLIDNFLIKPINGGPKKNLIKAIQQCADVLPNINLNGNSPLGVKEMEEKKLLHSPVSRNAPCPCGSGKKYKMCCGRSLS